MATAGIAFGGHGAEHRLLVQIPPDEARRDIHTSKRCLDAQLPAHAPVFAYPNGSVTRQVAEMVATSGYRLAFTTVPGSASCDDDPFTLKRMNIHESATASTPMFLARLLALC